jgi:hypothetical protein
MLDLEFRASRGELLGAGPYREAFPEYAEIIERAFAQAKGGLPASPTNPGSASRVGETHRGTLISDRTSGTMTSPGSGVPVANRRAGLDPEVHRTLLQAGFEVLGELGRGGMGVVFLARQANLNRHCALKMILTGALSSPELGKRFLTEAEAAAWLHHANIVQVYQIGEAGGRPYLARS